jgi:hypothetical protein
MKLLWRFEWSRFRTAKPVPTFAENAPASTQNARNGPAD